jgi:hypothetical protein
MSSRTFLGSQRFRESEGVTFEHVYDASLTDFGALASAQEELRRYLQGDLLPYVQYSAAQHDAVVAFSANLAKNQNLDQGHMYPIKCSVLTLASAIAMHKEQTRRDMMRRNPYGAVSETARTLDSLYYDSSFAYRFTVRLRNFLLHKTPEVIQINVGHSGAEPGGLVVPRTELTVSVRRDHLLDRDDDKDVWSAVRKEIETLGGEIELGPLLREAAQVSEKLASRARTLLFPGISRTIRYIEEWRDRFGNSTGTPIMVHVPDVEHLHGPDDSTFEVYDLNFALARSARHMLLESRE